MGANKVVTYRRIYALFRKKKKEIGDEIYMRENFDIPDLKSSNYCCTSSNTSTVKSQRFLPISNDELYYVHFADTSSYMLLKIT